jgi:tetrahydromethanopterin S-methyltransferase subunit G
MAIIAFPSILNERLTDAGAQALVDIFDKVEQDNQKTTLGIAEERLEKRMTQLDARIDRLEAKIDNVKVELEAKLGGVKTELEAKISGVKTELEAKIDGVESRLELKIEKSRADIIKWMFIFWIGQVGTIIALLYGIKGI